jgi:hypothetical protein
MAEVICPPSDHYGDSSRDMGAEPTMTQNASRRVWPRRLDGFHNNFPVDPGLAYKVTISSLR